MRASVLLAAEQFRFLKRLSRSLSTGLFPRFQDPRWVAIRFLKLSPLVVPRFRSRPDRGERKWRTVWVSQVDEPRGIPSRDAIESELIFSFLADTVKATRNSLIDEPASTRGRMLNGIKISFDFFESDRDYIGWKYRWTFFLGLFPDDL